MGDEFKNKKSGRAAGIRHYFTLEMPVDMVCYTPEEFEKQKKRISLVSQALKTAQEI